MSLENHGLGWMYISTFFFFPSREFPRIINWDDYVQNVETQNNLKRNDIAVEGLPNVSEGEAKPNIYSVYLPRDNSGLNK